eukprot:733545_1
MITRLLRKMRSTSVTSSLHCHLRVYRVSPNTYPCSSRALSSTDRSNNDNEIVSFPWRHDSLPPDRILEHEDFSGQYNPTKIDPPILRKLIAARELNIPLSQIIPVPFHTHEWESDLAINMAVGFEFAIAELLQSLFKVPVKNDNGIVSIDCSANNDNNNSLADCSESNEYLHGMMDKKLISEYNNGIDTENMQLKLSLQPIEAKLEHIFAIPVPGLTREVVEENPYLRANIYRLHHAYEETGFDEHYFDLLTDFAKNGPEKRTIIAEAAIKCNEFYQLTDANGTVIDGMEDDEPAEEVVHIVRYEVVTDEALEGSDSGEREIGQW